MNGGPGASSLMGFFTELGPILLNKQSLPANSTASWRPFSNPYTWSQLGALLVWEQPAGVQSGVSVHGALPLRARAHMTRWLMADGAALDAPFSGVGFSRCLEGCPSRWNDTTSAAANLAFVRAFYEAHPGERARDLVIAGESYGGIYVPMLAQLVLHDPALRAAGVRLRGVAIGDGCIGFGVRGGCGLDSLDIFVSTLERLAPGVSRDALAAVRAQCSAEELNSGRQPGQLSAACAAAMRSLFVEVGEYNEYHWASPCGPDGQGNWGDGSAFACATDVMPRYLALPQTQRALGVIAGAEPPLEWTQWDGDAPMYHITEADARPRYRDLLAHNVSMLIYSGLADTGVSNFRRTREHLRPCRPTVRAQQIRA